MEKTVDEVRSVEAAYQPKLSIYDGIDGANTYGRYWTNLNLDQPEIEGNGKQMAIELYNVDTNAMVVASRADIMEATGMKTLGQTEAADRIYTMEVKVYKTGANPAVDEPLITMTGSKME